MPLPWINLIYVFLGFEELKEKVITELSENNVESVFNESSNEIELIFDKLKENLFAIDKTLVEASARTKEKIFSTINELRAKAIKAQDNKYETTIRQLIKISNSLYPNGNLQEREINFVYFYNKYGKELIKKIYEDLSISEFEHQVIIL